MPVNCETDPKEMDGKEKEVPMEPDPIDLGMKGKGTPQELDPIDLELSKAVQDGDFLKVIF